MFGNYTDDIQLNFQINRAAVYGPEYMDMTEVRMLLPEIHDMSSWTQAWMKLAARAENEGRYRQATYYYRMAEFYIPDSSEEKDECYEKFRRCFEKGNEDEAIERFRIPYDGSYLPAMRIGKDNPKGVIVVHGGYDSFMEEFYPQIIHFRDMGYTVIMFEGPGQGQARRNGFMFSYDWERPTGAVLDYFDLKDVTLMGISWGGYLAPRAAAFDKRIINVICYDAFVSGLDPILNKLSCRQTVMLKMLLAVHAAPAINGILGRKMRGDLDLTWRVRHGMYITGTGTPYDFLKSISLHDIGKCADRITQNVLLLAGTEDMYVPLRRIGDMKKMLVNAASVTSYIFDAASGGAQHCQIGNTALAENAIKDFLGEYGQHGKIMQ